MVRSRLGAGCTLAAIAAGCCFAVPPAVARDEVVRSFDGTPIVISFFPAAGLKEGERAPTVLGGRPSRRTRALTVPGR